MILDVVVLSDRVVRREPKAKGGDKMALNFKSNDFVESSIAASKNSEVLDLAGYSKLAIQVKFGTCVGVAGSSGQYTLQTSNNNSDWTTMTGDIQTDESGNSLSGTTVYKYFPDNATADETGFGRYVRMRMVVTGAPSLTYTTYWIAKE